MQSILIVDDEEHFRNRLAKAFERRNFLVHTAADYDEAVEKIETEEPEMAVLDLKMPGKSGIEVLKKAREVHPDMRIIVLTGYGSIATAIEAVKLGAAGYLPKPADVDDILLAFKKDPEMEVDVDEEEMIPPSLARAEWEHINRVLADCNGNISATAQKLNIHRRTLQRKLQKYPPNK